MAYIFIRGRQDSIEVDQVDAIKVKNYLESGSPPSTVISFKDSSWKLSEIKGVKLDPKEQEDGFKEKIEQLNQDRAFMLKATPEYRAERGLPHFDIYHWSLTGEKPIKELRQTVKEKLIEFFTNNPKWTIPSQTVYKEFVTESNEVGSEFSTRLQRRGLDILDSCEWTERKLAGRLKE